MGQFGYFYQLDCFSQVRVYTINNIRRIRRFNCHIQRCHNGSQLALPTVTMTTQRQFTTHGEETRQLPAKQRCSFGRLLECERRHARLLEGLNAKLSPAVAAEVIRHPKRYRAKYHGSDLALAINAIQEVIDFNYHL